MNHTQFSLWQKLSEIIVEIQNNSNYTTHTHPYNNTNTNSSHIPSIKTISFRKY
jgi:hypothetical protein